MSQVKSSPIMLPTSCNATDYVTNDNFLQYSVKDHDL